MSVSPLTKASPWPLGDQTRVGLTSMFGASSRRAALLALTANKLFLALLPRIWRAVNASILGFWGAGVPRPWRLKNKLIKSVSENRPIALIDHNLLKLKSGRICHKLFRGGRFGPPHTQLKLLWNRLLWNGHLGCSISQREMQVKRILSIHLLIFKVFVCRYVSTASNSV